MAEQSGERPVTAEVGAELISLMVPDVDLELVRLMLSRGARSAAGGRADHEGHRGGGGEPQAALLQELIKLLVLIRDAGINRGQLRAILGLDPETPSADDDNPPPGQLSHGDRLGRLVSVAEAVRAGDRSGCWSRPVVAARIPSAAVCGKLSAAS